jgi:hypothetical protein
MLKEFHFCRVITHMTLPNSQIKIISAKCTMLNKFSKNTKFRAMSMANRQHPRSRINRNRPKGKKLPLVHPQRTPRILGFSCGSIGTNSNLSESIVEVGSESLCGHVWKAFESSFV